MASPSGNTYPLADVSQALAAAVEQVGQSVVAVLASRHGPASGVVWRPGVIVTSAHTIRREDGIKAILANGTKVDTTLAGIDASTDLAVLRAESAASSVADIGDAAQVRAGHFVFAVARDLNGEPAASFGIVGQTGGEWRTWRGGRIDRLIRLDGGLHSGFSGGAVANTVGELIGIGTSALSRGFGIVVPSSTVDRVVDQLLQSGRIARGYLGIGTQPVTLPASLTGKLGLGDRDGLIVLSLSPQGPAESGGLLVGDILVDLEGQPLQNVGDLQAALGAGKIGERVRLGVVRGGERVESTVTLAERPRRGC